jgi:hypothetical protein
LENSELKIVREKIFVQKREVKNINKGEVGVLGSTA